MKFTLSWLKRFLDTDANLEKITHTLTMIGLEVEEVIDRSQGLQGFEVAEIMSAEKHPDADKLRVCQVNTSEGVKQIVCGAPNARAGIKVVLAKADTLIPNGNFKIKKSVIRGVESNGMLCSYEELNLPGDSAGIIELSNDAKVGESFVKYAGLDDPIININITPNRADALGVYGIARDLSAAGIGALKVIDAPNIAAKTNSSTNVVIKDKAACPFFAIREISGLNNQQSPKWLKELLENIGIGSISPVVDVTNYISYSFGQPMHAYDADKIKGDLQIRLLDTNAKFNALNGKEHELAKGDLVIADNNGAQCLAGIIGGAESACDNNTNRIILEAASFDRDNVALTGRRLMIDTDSRYRFERNVNAEFTPIALDIATSMILEICGGEASAVKSDGNSSLEERKLEFTHTNLKEIAGFDLPLSKQQDILTKLGFGCENLANSFMITIPAWRYDVAIKEDIVEEIVRINGYDHIPEITLPGSNLSKILPKDKRRVSEFKRILAGRGYDEVVTWSFTDSNLAKHFTSLREDLFIQNPISSDLDYMRPAIIPNLLKLAAANLNRFIEDLAFFEVGPVFNDPNNIEIITHASGIKIGHDLEKNALVKPRKFDVFDIKADVEILFDAAGISLNKCQLSTDVPSYYHPTRSVKISLGKNILGYFGQVHPAILKKFDINVDVCIFEINMSNLPFGKDKFGKRPEFIVSNYQVVNRDFAFILDENQPVGEILNFIGGIDKNMIKKVSLFDLYMGENIAKGKKSIAISTELQDDNKTLTDAEIKAACNKIIEGVTQKFGAILRDS